MPASDTFHVGIPNMGRNAFDQNLQRWMQISEFAVQLDDITDTYSTGTVELTHVSSDLFLIKLSYRVAAAFRGSSEEALCSLAFGDTSDFQRFGTINNAQLLSVDHTGEIPINFASTAAWTLDLEFDANSTAISTGTLELWAHFRPSVRGNFGARAK